MTGFIENERLSQAAYFAAALDAEAAGYRESGYRLMPQYRPLNLAPDIRDDAVSYFAEKKIAWHPHANHGLSSQVCCVNFLMPLALRPDSLARLVGAALGIPPPTMLEVETGPRGQKWFVAFEWIGHEDYLNEAGKSGSRTRGANATSADAMVRFVHEGRVETLLIEWKYTESYGSPIPPNGNAERIRRYEDIIFAPSGPIRSDLALALPDFFFEPFYQLLRQQMLAYRMQEAHEDGATRVRVLHISPFANVALKKITAPALRNRGVNAFAVFQSLLITPDDFVSCTTEQLFGSLLSRDDISNEPWAVYLANRYGSLTDASAGRA